MGKRKRKGRKKNHQSGKDNSGSKGKQGATGDSGNPSSEGVFHLPFGVGRMGNPVSNDIELSHACLNSKGVKPPVYRL